MPSNLLYVKNFNKIAITDYTGKMSIISNLLADKQWFIVFIIFVVAIIIQLIYYLGIYLRFIIYRPKNISRSSLVKLSRNLKGDFMVRLLKDNSDLIKINE